MSVRLIAIDIDGTLLSSSGGSIGRRNQEALLAAEAAGIEVVIATGRRHAFALPLISPLGLRSETAIISSNGAVIRRLNTQTLSRQFLSAQAAKKMATRLRPYRTMVFTFDRDGSGGLVVEDLAVLHRRIERWVEANQDHIIEISPIERAFEGGDPPIQGMVCGTPAEMLVAEEELKSLGLSSESSMHRTEYAMRGLSILDLLPPGCSKGTALDELVRLLRLDRQEVMAIGDNLNDLEMLEYAGHPVVMANSSSEIRSTADERGWGQTSSNDENGVALAIEAVLSGTSGAGVTGASLTAMCNNNRKHGLQKPISSGQIQAANKRGSGEDGRPKLQLPNEKQGKCNRRLAG